MKPIVLTQEAKDNALAMFQKLLNEATGDSDLKINITTDTLLQEQGIQKPTVYITTPAYVKMMSLIKSSDKELAWYGTVSRVLHNYLIEDIYVYPQTVTSSTVDADEVKHAKWLMELSDDTINKLRFQGHSHVNMTASPSGRDTTNWQKFANILKPGEFYILCIGNKQGAFYWTIYDTAVNVYFENKDITMAVVDDKGNSIQTWAEDSIKKHITVETQTVFAGFRNGAVPVKTNVKPSYTLIPETSVSEINTLRQEALVIVPTQFKGEVDYEPETDMYYSDKPAIPGFIYDVMFGCYKMSGDLFRARYSNKKSVGRPKKDKTNEGRKK